MRAVIACLLVSCVSPQSDGELDVTAIEPVSGTNDKTTDVRIDGIGFEPRLVSNLDDGSTIYDGALDVTIGNTALLSATRINATTITGTVPANLTPGTYDVTVTLGPGTDTLVGAYTVEEVLPPLATSIEVDGSTGFTVRYQDSFIFTHPIGTGVDRAIVVGLSISFSGTQATTVTCNGAPMTRLVAHDAPSSDGRVELWALAAPASGPAAIEVTLSQGTSSTVVAGATSFANVDQAIPFGAPSTADAIDGDCAIDVPGGPDDVVYGIVNWGGGHYGSLIPAQASAWNRRIDEMVDGPSIVGAASLAAGPTSFRWAVNGGPQPPVDLWTAAGISLRPN